MTKPTKLNQAEDRLRAVTLSLVNAIHGPSDNSTERASQVKALGERLAPEKVSRLNLRLSRLTVSDQTHLKVMRDLKADPWELLQFIAAPLDCPEDDSPSRDSIYAGFQKRQEELHGQRMKESVLKVVVPLTLITVLSCVGAAAVLKGGALLAAGMDPSFAQIMTSSAARLHDILSPAVSYLTECGLDDWIGRTIVLAGAVHFLRPSGSFNDLKSVAMEEETPLISEECGPTSLLNKVTLHSAIRAIPEHERGLLGHLPAPALRRFLLSNTRDRAAILKENPPLLVNELLAVINAPREGWRISKAYAVLREISNACFPEKVRSHWDMNSPALSTNDRLARWEVKSVSKARLGLG